MWSEVIECSWSISCVQEASGSGPFCYLHSKVATGTIDFTYPVTRTSSKRFGAPSGDARRLMQANSERREDEDADG